MIGLVAHRVSGAGGGGPVRVRSGVGHVCTLEAPDELNRAIRDFLRTAV